MMKTWKLYRTYEYFCFQRVDTLALETVRVGHFAVMNSLQEGVGKSLHHLRVGLLGRNES